MSASADRRLTPPSAWGALSAGLPHDIGQVVGSVLDDRGGRMHRLRGVAVGSLSLLLAMCGAPSTGAAEEPRGGLTTPVYQGPKLDEPVFDVPCTHGRSSKGDMAAAGLPRLILDCLGPGPAVNTADLVGQVSVVNFWASWCGPCREEMPMLDSVAEEVGNTVRFVGVNTKDDPQAAADFLKLTGAGFEQLHDPDGELLRQLRTVQGLPITLVLDTDGAVTLRNVGQIDETTLRDALEAPP